MKSLMLFLRYLLLDCGRWCQTSTLRDYKTISERVEHEGLSFLTITLPSFGKDFEKSLERGSVGRDLFQGFSWQAGLPVFLRGFLDQVFDSDSGCLLDTPSVDAIFSVRQITLAFGKMQLPCTEKRTKAAIRKYVECEQDIKSSDKLLDGSFELNEFARIGRLLWSDLFQSVDEDIFYGRIIPNHSSGSVANRLSSNAKWSHLTWTSRLERIFPSMEYLFSGGWGIRLDHHGDVDILEPGAEQPVRVVSVPKTLKTPRIIAMEPSYVMYIQQGILHSIEENLANSFAGSFISWRSQDPNQVMARQGSITGELATLDLSEASDRVSYQHVLELVRNFPNLAEGIDACRSRKADVPDHGVLRLAKFASMGSALCFPFESMIFLTLIFLGIQKSLKRPLSRGDMRSFSGRVRVYGDDIIVPVDFVNSVVGTLELFGYKVNASKSFWNGKFRESCGKEYYAGEDVSFTKVRRFLPAGRKDVQEIVSTVSLRNQLYRAGLWQTVSYLDGILERLIPFPYATPDSPLLGRESFVDFLQPTRMCPRLQRPLVRGVVLSGRSPRDFLDDYGALNKCLTSLQQRESTDLPVGRDRHLERSGRPRTVDIKTRWETPN